VPTVDGGASTLWSGSLPVGGGGNEGPAEARVAGLPTAGLLATRTPLPSGGVDRRGGANSGRMLDQELVVAAVVVGRLAELPAAAFRGGAIKADCVLVCDEAKGGAVQGDCEERELVAVDGGAGD
jgi:hypothetical protein